MHSFMQPIYLFWNRANATFSASVAQVHLEPKKTQLAESLNGSRRISGNKWAGDVLGQDALSDGWKIRWYKEVSERGGTRQSMWQTGKDFGFV